MMRGERFSAWESRAAERTISAQIGAASATNTTPRKMSLPIACGSPALTNCGRKVTKNMMILGLSRLTPRPLAQAPRTVSRAEAAPVSMLSAEPLRSVSTASQRR
jgi:hypothetical protein